MKTIYYFIVLCVLAVTLSCSDGIVSSSMNPDRNQPPVTQAPGTQPVDPAAKTWQVTIDQNGGTGVPQTAYQITDGQTLNLDTPPSYTGYVLLGFKDDLGKDFVLNSTPVTRDMTITAQWKKLWTVTINLNGGTGLLKTSYTVRDGESLDGLSNNPTPPTSLSFDSYTGLDGTPFILGTTPVTTDTTVKIKWVLDPNLNCSSVNAGTSLATFIANNDPLGVACAVKSAADPTINNGVALNTAAKSGSLDALKVLIASGANLNTPDAAGNPPLYNAVDSGSAEAVKLLIAGGADINKQGSYGTTPLNKAANGGSLEVVKVLVESGANLNIGDANGYSPTFNAVRSDNNLEILKYLIETGKADLTHRGAGGWTTFIMACSTDAIESIKYLISIGQDPNQRDTMYGTGMTCLDWTLQYDNYKVFKYLITYPGINLTGLLPTAIGFKNSYPKDAVMAQMVADLEAVGAPK